MLAETSINDFCYSYNDGEFYVIFSLYGWATVMMCGDGAGYTMSFAEH